MYSVDIVDIALCICRLLLYNNFKRGVMSRVNVCLTFRMLLYFRISNSVMLSSDNRNSLIIGCSLQGTVLNMFSMFLMWLDIILIMYCDEGSTSLP